MSKETRKFEIKVTETITTTHEVEVPISFLDQHLTKRVGDDVEGIVHDNYDEFIKPPEFKSKTITDVEFYWDSAVDVEEITDE
jgi:hypothetical protein